MAKDGKDKQEKKAKASKGEGSKKRKADAGASAPSSSASGLFGGVHDAALDDLFSKGDAFAKTAKSVTALPKPASAAAPESQPARPSKKPKKTPAADTDDEIVAPVAEAAVAESSKRRPAAALLVAADGPSEASDDDDDEAASELVHESVKAKQAKRAARGKTEKYVPPGESAADRDRRTVFVGNLPVDVAKTKHGESQLRAHLLGFAPSAKVESIRFRSIAFATPTTALPSDDPARDERQRRKHERERAAAWRDKGGASGVRAAGDEVHEAPKVFLDAKGKRKVAFIKKDFHDELASCNAYVVFAHPHPSRSANVAPILDPYEAAAHVLAANGSVFLERTIKVDALRAPSAVGLASAATALAKRDAWLPAGADPKRSLFVGGLDYAEKEESVRAFFEGLVAAERGAKDGGAGHWVESVRLVRDKDTQLGKGFGYVYFADRESVDEILALDSKKLKLNKRPLRVQQSKTLPPKPSARPVTPAASSAGTSAAGGGPAARKGTRPVPTPGAPLPKGDPSLGDKLRDLSKEDRKAAKATDATRLARRMAKKRSKAGTRGRGGDDKGTGRVSLAPSKADKLRTASKVKAKKGRVRSANALKKMKGSRE